MEKSIKKAIWMRVALIFVVVIVSGTSTVMYLRKIKRINEAFGGEGALQLD